MDAYNKYKVFIKSKEKYSLIDGYVPEFGGGMPLATFDISYDEKGGYSAHIKDNMDKTHSIAEGVQIKGFRDITINNNVTENRYVMDTDISYIESKSYNSIAQQKIKETSQYGISAREMEFKAVNGDNVKDIYIGAGLRRHLYYNGLNLIDLSGKYYEVNGSVEMATGTQKVCFEKNGETIRRLPQPLFSELMEDFLVQNMKEDGRSNGNDMQNDVSLNSENEMMQVEITDNGVVFVRPMVPVGYTQDSDLKRGLENWFGYVRRECGLDNRDDLYVAPKEKGYEGSRFGSRASKVMIGFSDKLRLEGSAQMDEMGTTEERTDRHVSRGIDEAEEGFELE